MPLSPLLESRLQLCSPIKLFTESPPACGHTKSTNMSFDVVTSSFDEKIPTRSATKAILDFESCLFLRLP